jgi:DNA-binding transcriptional regulator YhcF (GntR family)
MTLKVRVSRSKTESLTKQITNQITNMIEAGALAAGSMLPSERTLADALGVARNVVRRSYNYLTTGGYVESEGRHGRRVRSSGSKKGSGRKAATSGKSSKKASGGRKARR